MSTDIHSVIATSQRVVDKAVAIITSTTKTQSVLEDNIKVTDNRIYEHNVDPMTHQDLREVVSNLPAMVDDPTITGPNQIENGETITWQLKSAARISSIFIDSFEITLESGEVIDLPAVKGAATYSGMFYGDRFSKHSFSVVAIGQPGNFRSHPSTFDFTITKNIAPSAENFTHTFPTIVNKGQSYQFTINGFTDVDDNVYGSGSDIKNIEIIPCRGLSFDKVSGIIQGETITATVTNDATPSTDVTFSVKATDTKLASVSVSITAYVNANPSTAGIVITGWPNNFNSDSTNTVSIANVIDPDGDTVTYNITCDRPEIAFSKTQNIGMNEQVTITVGTLAPKTPYNITLLFSDGKGGSVTHVVASTINTPPKLEDLVINYETPADKESGVAGGTTTSEPVLTNNQEMTMTFGEVPSEGEPEESYEFFIIDDTDYDAIHAGS